MVTILEKTKLFSTQKEINKKISQTNFRFLMDQPRPLFAYFRSIQTQKYKIVCFSRIQTRIARVEGKHADHLTITTPPSS